MALTKMTVTDSGGRYNIKDDAGVLVKYAYYVNAESPPTTDIYRFYAAAAGDAKNGEGKQVGRADGTNTAGPIADYENKVHGVTLVMPIGGTETGIGRFPELGEQVLVAEEITLTDGDVTNVEYYLMGYIPSALTTGQPFSAPLSKTEAVENEGFALRYKQSAGDRESVSDKKPNGGGHSEIAFYNKATSWMPSADDTVNAVEAKTGNAVVDHIHIKSTGDIHNEAANYHKIKANRLEILSDCADPDHTRTNGDIDEGKDGAAMPFGDTRYDDHLLHKGDIHLRANNRVVIKAGKEIRLQVGHSVITLTDAMLTAICRKVNQNLVYTWDSALFLTQRSGTTLSGPSVAVSGGTSASVNEAWGGGLTSSLGNVKITGRDIQSSNLTGLDYVAEVGKNLGDMAVNATGFGKYNTKTLDGKAVMDYLKYGRKIYNAVINFVVALIRRIQTVSGLQGLMHAQERAQRTAYDPLIQPEEGGFLDIDRPLPPLPPDPTE
jgi:hypothetical protein